MQQYDDLTFYNRKGSQLYTREADLRQDPTMLNKKKKSSQGQAQNIYMNQV